MLSETTRIPLLPLATAVLADKVAALEARIAKPETPTPPPVTSERFEAVDFAKANAGHLFTGNLIGKGSPATTPTA